MKQAKEKSLEWLIKDCNDIEFDVLAIGEAIDIALTEQQKQHLKDVKLFERVINIKQKEIDKLKANGRNDMIRIVDLKDEVRDLKVQMKLNQMGKSEFSLLFCKFCKKKVFKVNKHDLCFECDSKINKDMYVKGKVD